MDPVWAKYTLMRGNAGPCMIMEQYHVGAHHGPPHWADGAAFACTGDLGERGCG
jgi:hypothetical protein